jgi:hypothetical protein
MATVRRHALSIRHLASRAFKKTLPSTGPKRLDFVRVFFYDEALKKTLRFWTDLSMAGNYTYPELTPI